MQNLLPVHKQILVIILIRSYLVISSSKNNYKMDTKQTLGSQEVK